VAGVTASELVREAPDTLLAAQFDGEPMVQSFRAGPGRAWLTTAEALTIPRFGRDWVADRLTHLEREMGRRAFHAALRRGLRLHAPTPELALAA
jgi:hypothetical protein